VNINSEFVIDSCRESGEEAVDDWGFGISDFGIRKSLKSKIRNSKIRSSYVRSSSETFRSEIRR